MSKLRPTFVVTNEAGIDFAVFHPESPSIIDAARKAAKGLGDIGGGGVYKVRDMRDDSVHTVTIPRDDRRARAAEIARAEFGRWKDGATRGVLEALAAAALAGMETEPASAPKWKVGDPDPTPTSGGRIGCIATTPDGRFICTWPAGHPGQHVAGTGFEVVAVWDDDDDDHAPQGDPITSTTD